MEPITLCGLIIVMIGLWVEFEPALKAVINRICNSKLCKVVVSNSTVQKPVYGRRMPLCVAKGIGCS
jgi:hypothetical protein